MPARRTRRWSSPPSPDHKKRFRHSNWFRHAIWFWTSDVRTFECGKMSLYIAIYIYMYNISLYISILLYYISHLLECRKRQVFLWPLAAWGLRIISNVGVWRYIKISHINDHLRTIYEYNIFKSSNLLEGRKRQILRLLQREGVAVALLKVRLRALRARACYRFRF